MHAAALAAALAAAALLTAWAPVGSATGLALGGPGSGYGHEPAVMKVSAGEPHACTAFAVSERIYLSAKHCELKAGHVLHGTEAGGIEAVILRTAEHPTLDAVLLYAADCSIDGYCATDPTPLTLDFSPLAVGLPVAQYGYGYTDGADHASWHVAKNQIMATGSVSATGVTISGKGEVFQTTGFATCRGDSGGPVLRQGTRDVIGLHVSGLSDWGPYCGTQGDNIPMTVLRDWLDSTIPGLR